MADKFSPAGQPFVWIPTAALDKVRESCPQASTAISVLVALYNVACRERSETFSKPLGYLAAMAGIGRRTIIQQLADLEQTGVVQIRRSKTDAGENATNIYTLPSLRGSAEKTPPSAEIARGSANDGRRPLHPSYRSNRNPKEPSVFDCL